MSDTTALEKPKNLEEAMRDKIRVAFAELIPDETLDELIQKEWQRFAEGHEDRYGRKEEADLTKLLRAAIDDWVKKELAPRINDRINQFFTAYWEVETGAKTWDEFTDESLKTLIKASGKTLAEYMMARFVNDVMQGVQQSISSMMNRGY